jgi:hypothetical protein
MPTDFAINAFLFGLDAARLFASIIPPLAGGAKAAENAAVLQPVQEERTLRMNLGLDGCRQTRQF